MKPKNYYSSERPEMLGFVPSRRKRVLEIGCGEGRFMSTLTGVEESWGIEPSPVAELAKRHFTRVLQATFDDARGMLPIGHFDLIICNDVIEHMLDHMSFISSVKDYIAPGGMLIGSIPNVRFYANMFRYLFVKDWCYKEYGVLDYTHLAFFTCKSLRRTLKQQGYKVLAIRGINTDYRFSGSILSWSSLIGAYMLVILTVGYFRDIRHLQFGFQAIPMGNE